MALEVLAVILGIFYTIRKLDAVGRAPEEFPHVSAADFLAWQSRERSLYHVAVLACALKLVVGLSFQHLLAPRLPSGVVRAVGASIDIAWLFVVLRTWWGSTGLRKERARLGISLGMRAPPAQAAEASDEEED